MRVVLSFLFLTLFIQSFGQNRIPSDGENIIFYPLNENNAITAEGYDCFYDKVLVAKNGKYKFKPKFRFNRNEDNTTSSDNIELSLQFLYHLHFFLKREVKPPFPCCHLISHG